MNRKRRYSGFWECMTVTEAGCWEWQGYREPNGYGQVRVNKKLYKTHRLAFELTYGYIPQVVCHKCDNPPCCNPAHLFGGTHADNIADKIAKGRGRTNPLRGEKSTSAKLTAEQVQTIRDLHKQGKINQSAIARQLGVTQALISSIVLRKKWKHL